MTKVRISKKEFCRILDREVFINYSSSKLPDFIEVEGEPVEDKDDVRCAECDKDLTKNCPLHGDKSVEEKCLICGTLDGHHDLLKHQVDYGYTKAPLIEELPPYWDHQLVDKLNEIIRSIYQLKK